MTKALVTKVKTARKASVESPARPALKVATKPAPKAAAKKSAAPPATASRAARPAAGTTPAASSAAAEPSLRFYHSKALRTKTHAVFAALEAKPDHPQHGDAMADLVTELIEAGMDYYFMRVLKQAQVGFVAEQSARLGMSGAVKLVSSVSRKFIVRMDRNQLLIVAQHIRTLS